jgi:sulfide:quinone oxidoreductase
MAKVLVLGGGFAGVEAAIFLRRDNHEVTLISDRDYMYIYPTSIWVPVGIKEFEDVCIPMSELSGVHGFKFIKDEVTSVSAEEMKVVTKGGEFSGFDYLVIAMGLSKMKHKGIENTLSICGKPQEAKELKIKLSEVIAKGKGDLLFGFGGNPNDSSAVRGGPAFELMFNVHNLLKKKGVRENFKIVFYAPMEKPGAKMGDKALEMMDTFFKRLDIDRHVGKKIKRFENDGVVFEDDSKLEGDFNMFIAAGAGHEVLQNSDMPLTEAGFVKCDEFCVVDGFERVFVIGDSAQLRGPAWRAKQGHVAEVMARNTAANITLMEKGRKPQKSYMDHLNILCVMDTGDGAAFVYRSDKRGVMIPMPIIGHWLKRGWGVYNRASKLNKIPRIPGM